MISDAASEASDSDPEDSTFTDELETREVPERAKPGMTSHDEVVNERRKGEQRAESEK
jgi:hypothetical protein